jgi:hypothetical protein
MRRKIELFIVTGSLLLLGASARAQGPDVPHGPALLAAAKAVGLSTDQVGKIKKIALATQREAISLQAKLRMSQLELEEAMEGDAIPSEQKVATMVDKIGQLENQLKKGHILMMLRIRGTMNKTQWDKLQLLHAERQGGPSLPPGPPGPPPGPAGPPLHRH